MKKKPAGGGGESCPLWYISFADMVSLLMAFFVMLASFSAGSTDETKYREFLKSLQEAFHFPVTVSSGNEPDAQELLGKLEQLAMRNFQHTGVKSDGDGKPGTINTIKRTREGIEFTIGGQLGFESGSAELRDEAKAAVAEIVEYIRGENNKVEIRGHATKLEAAGAGKASADEHNLAYERACAVADYLIGQGIRAERLRRVDCGSSEPLIVHAYDEPSKRANRRVEIIVTQAMVQEFEGTEGEAPAPPVAGQPAHQAEPAPTDSNQVSGVSVPEGN